MVSWPRYVVGCQAQELFQGIAVHLLGSRVGVKNAIIFQVRHENRVGLHLEELAVKLLAVEQLLLGPFAFRDVAEKDKGFSPAIDDYRAGLSRKATGLGSILVKGVRHHNRKLYKHFQNQKSMTSDVNYSHAFHSWRDIFHMCL
jgi:hypothetical protein